MRHLQLGWPECFLLMLRTASSSYSLELLYFTSSLRVCFFLLSHLSPLLQLVPHTDVSYVFTWPVQESSKAFASVFVFFPVGSWSGFLGSKLWKMLSWTLPAPSLWRWRDDDDAETAVACFSRFGPLSMSLLFSSYVHLLARQMALKPFCCCCC